MKTILSFLFRVSRFRFWIYTGGTYVVGYALGFTLLADFFRPEYYLYLFYFFIPANLFIYGVNDYWDEETDILNPKKNEKEYRVNNADRKKLLNAIYLATGFSLILILFQNLPEKIIFTIFLLLSYFYSAKPLRFKDKPFLRLFFKLSLYNAGNICILPCFPFNPFGFNSPWGIPTHLCNAHILRHT